MFKLVAEQPILLSILLGLIGGTLLYVWSRESQKWFGIAGLAFLLLIPVAWLAAGMIVTEEERIEATIRDFASKVEVNDFDTALQAIHPDKPEILARAKAELPKYEFSRARVGGINKIVLVPESQPPRAVVDLMASVKVSMKSGGMRDVSVIRRLLLYMESTPSGWKVIDYTHRPAIGPSDSYSTGGESDWERYLKPSST